mmetsp:Transcript_17814/g.49409  ORF Transcript_17814/g.49409 Transcript_17814/m.49409 type:complete len:464 (+) Transcript_17814:83-1474(+)
MWPAAGQTFAFPVPAPTQPASFLAPALRQGSVSSSAWEQEAAEATSGTGSHQFWSFGAVASATVLLGGLAAVSLRQAKRGAAGKKGRVVRLAQEGEDVVPEFAGNVFPFSAVVGQKETKLALILNLVDPVIGGVLIQGERGTGKSCAVRALVRLLPEIPSVVGDKYNSDPYEPNTMSEEVRERYLDGEELPTVMRRTPFVELPLGATEDRVTGTIDIEQALLKGGKAFEPGILARVNRGIMYIDEVNLLDDTIVDVLLDSAAGGWNTVEREGVSVRHPSRFVLIGTAHPDEGDLRPQLLDRFGCTVGIRTNNDAEARFQVLKRTNAWQFDAAKMEAKWGPKDAALKQKIMDARARLKSVKCDRELAVKISNVCSRLNVDGLRGDIVTNRAARALAAYEGRTEVTEKDVRKVAVMCLNHRLRKNVVSDNLDNSDKVAEELMRVFGKGPVAEAPPKQAVPAGAAA